MEDSFIEFLDSVSKYPLGTALAIIIGGFLVIGGIVTAINKVKQKYDDKLAKKLIKEREEKDFKNSMQKVAEQVTSIQADVTNLTAKHEGSIAELNTKLEDVWTAVIESQRDSKEGDISLENQMKNFELALDNMNVKVSTMDDKTTLLIESDKESIKSFIIDKYYQALDDGCIKDHVMQGLELRYDKYLQENGNTYIGRLMNEIRKMPNEPPTQSRPTSKDHYKRS